MTILVAGNEDVKIDGNKLIVNTSNEENNITIKLQKKDNLYSFKPIIYVSDTYQILKGIKEKFPTIKTYVWSGYTLEELQDGGVKIKALGELTEEEAKDHPKKNVLMKALGANDPIDIDIFDCDTDISSILLCSDGLTNMLDNDQIEKVLLSDLDIEDKVIKSFFSFSISIFSNLASLLNFISRIALA